MMNNMIYIAYELLAKLRYLTLAGQDENGDLEWIGTDKERRQASLEEESILRDNDIKNENNSMVRE